jgi:hypothetical protein
MRIPVKMSCDGAGLSLDANEERLKPKNDSVAPRPRTPLIAERELANEAEKLAFVSRVLGRIVHRIVIGISKPPCPVVDFRGLHSIQNRGNFSPGP